ncbi:helix-turn-helix domain-containing protein [Ferrovibrio sp.]|uniref:helix-turn-helix domain-containing protein n=1 Tax=Ferrovibrio sp. TaxID=1917215 RepID=UPI003D2DAE4E
MAMNTPKTPNRSKTRANPEAQADLGRRIRLFREFRELTLEQLARACRCRAATLVEYEAGRRAVAPRLLGRIAEVLGFEQASFTSRAQERAGDFELERLTFLFGQIESERERGKLLRAVAQLADEHGAKPH